MTTLETKRSGNASALRSDVRRIVLTGFMGAGKSTVGRALAKALGWSFVDIDAAIEERHGCVIAELFVKHGEPGFRQMESMAVAKTLATQEAVIALGGGALESLTNRLLLEQTPGTAIAFLDAPFAELYDRCMLQPDAALRPVLADPAVAEERFRHRLPFYRRTAKVTAPTTGLTVEQTVAALLKQLQG